MCYEFCGPDYSDAQDVEDYTAWLNGEWDEDEEDETGPEEISEYDALESFEDFVNDTYETVTIMGYSYDPARALKELDPIAYREEFSNWIDSNREEFTVAGW